MKLLQRTMVIGFALLVAGCESGVGERISAAVSSVAFPVSVAIPKQTVDGALGVVGGSCEELASGQLSTNAIRDLAIDIDSSQDMAGKGGVDKLRSLKLTNITLAIVDEAPGDTDTFDFIEAISFYSSGDGGDVLLANLDPVPRGVKQIVAAGVDQNIKAMAAAESFKIVTRAKGRLPCDDVHLSGTANFIANPF